MSYAQVSVAEAVRRHLFDLRRRLILRAGESWSDEVVVYGGSSVFDPR